MVNLLGRRSQARALDWVDAGPGGGLDARLGSIVHLASTPGLAALESELDVFEADLEELDSAPSRVAALALLEAITGLRREAVLRLAVAGLGPDGAALLARGEYVCHRPGVSLATGEAEIASRGFFDAWDRPPRALWLGLLAAPDAPGDDAEELWIVAWVPPAQIEAAFAGCRACPNGALVRLGSLSPEAEAALRALEAREGIPL
jgi:hypothetical protein